jgi:hypothetical protein
MSRTPGTPVRSYTHHGHTSGGHRSPEYIAWAHLLDRCRNPKNRKYPSYGGRGITVCERWNSFPNFLADMGLRLSPKHSLDRIENDGPYNKANCRWATKAEQNRNKRTNRHVPVAGKSLCLVDAARLAGLSLGTLRMRLEHGWPLERALHAPVRRRRTSAPATSADARS